MENDEKGDQVKKGIPLIVKNFYLKYYNYEVFIFCWKGKFDVRRYTTTPKMAAGGRIDVQLLQGFPEVSSSEVAGLPSPGVAPPRPLLAALFKTKKHT